MPEPPTDTTPTYLQADQGGVIHYTCLVQDASRPGGVCSHDATDFELFTQHMEQRHAGILIAAPPAEVQGTVQGTPALSPTVPIASDIVQPVESVEPTTQEPEAEPEDVPADEPPPPGEQEG